MGVELLFVDGCPGHAAVLERLPGLMARAAVDVPVTLTRVDSAEQARRLRFLGSPTLRVDGRDVEPAAAGREDFDLKCRLYGGEHGLTGVVPDALIVDALARGREGAHG